MTDKSEQLNVLGEPLAECSLDPLTGWRRDGLCADCRGDHGRHLVCVKASKQFLEFSLAAGNDLSTPRPDHGFPGLQPGDFWCVCAIRWLQAHEAGCAPPVRLAATSEAATEIIPIQLLREAACDLD